MSKVRTKPGRPKAGEIETRKKKILVVATQLFIDKGYDNVTLLEIGKGAGVTKRTIYEHIGDKEALFYKVCMESLPEVLETKLEVDINGRVTSEVLEDLAQQVLKFALSKNTISLARMLMVEKMRFPELVQQVAMAMRKLYNKLIKAILDDMVKAGLLPPSNTSYTADYFYDIVVGNMQLQMLFDVKKVGPRASEVKRRVDIFLHGVLGTQQDKP